MRSLHAPGYATNSTAPGLELAVSAMRVITVVVYWMLFRDLIRSRAKSFRPLCHPLLLASVIIALSVPVAFQGGLQGVGLGTTIVFVITSFIVGFREELLYRVVMLDFLQPKLGTTGALAGFNAAIRPVPLRRSALYVDYHNGNRDDVSPVGFGLRSQRVTGHDICNPRGL